MVLKIAISEAHNELLNSSNTLSLQSIAKELDFSIAFIKDMITDRNIYNYQVIIIGGSTEPLEYSEISIIEKFVNHGGFLLIFSVAGGDIGNSNLSELSRRFEFEFNPDYVESYKHNLNGNPRIPIIYFIKKNFPITKNINKIAYAGCSISILDSDVKGVLFTDKDSIPTMAPVGVISETKNIIGLAGSSLFNDTLIEKYNNKKFIKNIFRFISNILRKREKELRNKYENLTISKAIKLFEHQISINSRSMNEIDILIDKLWSRIIEQSSRIDVARLKDNLKKSYKLIIYKIDALASQVSEKKAEFSFFGQEFEEASNELLNSWYSLEAEKREKLDMIRNNLLVRIDGI